MLLRHAAKQLTIEVVDVGANRLSTSLGLGVELNSVAASGDIAPVNLSADVLPSVRTKPVNEGFHYSLFVTPHRTILASRDGRRIGRGILSLVADTNRETTSEGWRRGQSFTPRDRLPEFLLDGAQHHARRALRLKDSSDPFDALDAAISAGLAVEWLAKACVAKVDPGLLVKHPTRGVNGAITVLHLRGLSVGPASWDGRISTIDVTTAVDLAKTLHPGLAAASTAVREVADLRNDAVHLSLVDPERLAMAVTTMVRYVDAALPVLGVLVPFFWISLAEVQTAEEITQARTEELQRSVDDKVAKARQWYEGLAGSLSGEQLRLLVRGLERQLEDHEGGAGGYVERCPACGRYGWLRIEEDYDVEPLGDGQFNYFKIGEWVAGFDCPVCRLTLDPEEAVAAGLGAGREPAELEPDVD